MSRRASSLPAEVTDLLGYLADMGFRDLYLGGRAARGGEAVAAPSASEAPPPPIPSSAAVATAPAAGPDERRRLLEALAVTASGCTACKLSEGRRQVVFGSGKADADLMLIGEGPGAEEDRQGLPFVGPAGQLLTKILQAIELDRDEVYIANVVKCRPPGNRDPEPEEVAACRGYLEQQIDLVRPRLIVALGRVAAQALLGTEAPLSRLRNQWHEVRGVPVRVTYHPAALLRNPTFKRPTWEDMKLVRARLAQG